MIPQQLLISIAVLACVLVVSIVGFKLQSNLALAALVAFPPLVFLISRPDALLSVVIALFASTITFPGMPQNLNAFYILAAMLLGLSIARKIINKTKSPWHAVHIWLFFFALVMFVTAYIRGFGLRVLGDSRWGGAQYVQLWIGIGLFFAARDIRLTPRMWRRTIYLFLLASLLPVLAQWIYAFSGGRLYHIYYFIVPDSGAVSYAKGVEAGAELTRLHIANVASTCVFTLGLILRRRRSLEWLFLGLVGIAVYFAGISGHRIALVYNGFLAVIFALTRRDTPLIKRLVTPYAYVALFGFILACAMASHLPLNFQRALAWLPFVDVSMEASLDASGTVAWRMDVWGKILSEVPDYLLLGKGFAFSMSDMPTFFSTVNMMDSADFFITSRNYHNGALSLLLDLGAAGFICGIGFIVAALRRQWRNLNRTWTDAELGYLHRVMYACFITQVLVYFILAGGPTSFVSFFVYYLILEGLHATDLKLAEVPAPRTPRPVLRRRAPLPGSSMPQAAT
jgi:hypothetical protein